MGEVLEPETYCKIVVPDDAVAIVDRLAEVDRLRRRLAAEQLELAAGLLAVRAQERIAIGVPQERWACGVAGETALASGASPHRAAGVLARAVEVRRNRPYLRRMLAAGEIAPEVVAVIVSGLSHLDPALRRIADERLCAGGAVAGLGLRRVRDAMVRVAYELDAAATVAKAAKDRRVSIRPEPDAMARVSVLLPVAQAVSVYATLKRFADGVAGVAGEVRTRSQVMADRAFALLTGCEAASGVPVAVNLTVPASVLLGGAAGTAHIGGGGPVPGEIARALVGRVAAGSVAWVRRLFVAPESGAVVALESRARRFPAGLAAVVAARDQYCRTPYCDAPIAHIDHVRRHASGGVTSADNGQGLCAACNYAKEANGWVSVTVDDESGRHTVETTTPTGHTYRSTATRIVA